MGIGAADKKGMAITYMLENNEKPNEDITGKIYGFGNNANYMLSAKNGVLACSETMTGRDNIPSF